MGYACAYLITLAGALHVSKNVEQNNNTDTNQGDEEEKEEAKLPALHKRVGA